MPKFDLEQMECTVVVSPRKPPEKPNPVSGIDDQLKDQRHDKAKVNRDTEQDFRSHERGWQTSENSPKIIGSGWCPVAKLGRRNAARACFAGIVQPALACLKQRDYPSISLSRKSKERFGAEALSYF